MLFKRNITKAALTALIVLASISLFEAIEYRPSGLTLWESYVVTIAFITLCAAGISFMVSRKQSLLSERLEQEKAERRQAEEKYRDLFEHANDAILLVDADHRFVDVNRKVGELLGYTKEELLKMGIADIIPPDQASRSATELEKLRTQGSYENFVGKVRRRDGQWVDVEVSSSAIVVDGKVVGSRDVVRDITERKKAEAEREGMISELKESLAKVRTLSGLLPICAGCKKIRDDKGYWTQIEAYLHEHAATEFTHGLCPQCAKELFPDYDKDAPA
jgi:PAS domain S-box-containing protein